ncbi:uncharacterized protein LOC143203264 [Rhynchophorus ferrugineus]|uniref:H15 domain-containing protein n=1 Tax=Rhynchophorus ferrugineus TaxID=354439 RepID=A0A834I5M5_RHYFE|nr:hypothetical protein GWI33_013865 [Rhynchophorus ferrugineus]
MKGPLNDKGLNVATRRVAKIVLATIKKLGSSRGITLKKIHNYIQEEYPNTSTNIIRLNNTLDKALAFGAINKKSGKYVLGTAFKTLIENGRGTKSLSIIQARRRRRRRGRRGRSRSRRRGKKRSISLNRRSIKSK